MSTPSYILYFKFFGSSYFSSITGTLVETKSLFFHINVWRKLGWCSSLFDVYSTSNNIPTLPTYSTFSLRVMSVIILDKLLQLLCGKLTSIPVVSVRTHSGIEGYFNFLYPSSPLEPLSLSLSFSWLLITSFLFGRYHSWYIRLDKTGIRLDRRSRDISRRKLSVVS